MTPEWLKHQCLAHRVVWDLLDASSVRRAKTSGLVEIAAYGSQVANGRASHRLNTASGASGRYSVRLQNLAHSQTAPAGVREARRTAARTDLHSPAWSPGPRA
jgi:hypothetical protein